MHHDGTLQHSQISNIPTIYSFDLIFFVYYRSFLIQSLIVVTKPHQEIASYLAWKLEMLEFSQTMLRGPIEIPKWS